MLAKFNSKGKKIHTWTILYDTAAHADGGRSAFDIKGQGSMNKGRGKRAGKRHKHKTLKQYAIDDGNLICVRDLRDDDGGDLETDNFMRFEDECAKQGYAFFSFSFRVILWICYSFLVKNLFFILIVLFTDSRIICDRLKTSKGGTSNSGKGRNSKGKAGTRHHAPEVDIQKPTFFGSGVHDLEDDDVGDEQIEV